MKKRSVLCLLLCLMMALQLMMPVGATESDPSTEPTEQAEMQPQTVPSDPYAGVDASIVSGCNTIDGQVPLRSQYILNTAQGALLYELNSDTLVYGYNIDTKFYPGGFTKLLVAIIALEECSLSEKVTVTQSALDDVPEDSLLTGIKLGEEFTMEQILYALILHSGNDTATVVAEHVAGSQEAFVHMMNEKARELGCTATHFVNTHGVHDDDQYTTVRDLAKILSYGVQNPTFVEMLSKDVYTVDKTNLSTDWIWYSRNYMFSMIIMEEYYDYRVNAGTSAQDKDGLRSSFMIAEEGDLKYLALVTGTKPVYAEDNFSISIYNEFAEMTMLLDLGFDGYEVCQVLFDGQITSQFTVANGTNSVVAGPDRSVITVIPDHLTLNDLQLKYQHNANGTLYAPVEKGQRLDVVQIWLGDVCLGQADLYAMNSSRLYTPESEQEDNAFGDGIKTGLIVFGVLVGVVVALAAILYIVRFVRISMFRSRSRRRRSSRRRTR